MRGLLRLHAPTSRTALRGKPRDESGFTIVEVMVSLAIFLIVSAAVLGLVMLSLGTVRANADRVYAAALAREALDDIRALPAKEIPLGQSTYESSTDAGDFTVMTETTWVDLGASVNPCDAGEGVLENGASYLRVFVQVVGGQLKGPQRVEAVIYPTDAGQGESPEVANDDTGTMTIAVRDVNDEPVSGVLVQGSLTGVTPDSFSQTTGATGCLFVPDLLASADWKVSLTVPGGYITENASGSVQAATVDTLLNTPVTFIIAQPGTVTFTAGNEGFPVPAGMPFEFAPDSRGLAPTSFDAFPVEVPGLWPATYTAWLRPCEGALDGSPGSAVLQQGGSATVTMVGTKVELVGPPGESVTVTYAPQPPDPLPDGWAPPCGATYELGTFAIPVDADDEGVEDGVAPLLPQKAMLPAGTWTITTAAGSTTVVLDALDAKCSVSFPVPDAISEEDYATLVAEYEAAVEAKKEDDTVVVPDLPDPAVVLPAVSDPCDEVT